MKSAAENKAELIHYIFTLGYAGAHLRQMTLDVYFNMLDVFKSDLKSAISEAITENIHLLDGDEQINWRNLAGYYKDESASQAA